MTASIGVILSCFHCACISRKICFSLPTGLNSYGQDDGRVKRDVVTLSVAPKTNKISIALREYLIEAGKVCRIEKAVLFGSRATSGVSRSGDIDVAIFSNEITDKNRLQMMKMMLLRGRRLKLDIQPLAFSFRDYLRGDNDFIRNEIKKKGIVIYSRT